MIITIIILLLLLLLLLFDFSSPAVRKPNRGRGRICNRMKTKNAGLKCARVTRDGLCVVAVVVVYTVVGREGRGGVVCGPSRSEGRARKKI